MKNNFVLNKLSKSSLALIKGVKLMYCLIKSYTFKILLGDNS
ncbi:uncharacterized protein METZ01_LOCUS224510 [marine metagenome]|uniref:Uncharacterized protein n=1 Tax=marine metagenome TaxID=408172 RepID=A0A382G8T2_9ZZZZ